MWGLQFFGLHSRSALGPGDVYVAKPVAPVAYPVICEPGLGLFREFTPPRVHTDTNSWRLFPVHTLTRGKRDSVS